MTDLEWWINTVDANLFPLKVTEPEIDLNTDATTSGGCSAVCQSKQTESKWSNRENIFHVNVH